MTRKYGFGFGNYYHIMEIYAFLGQGTSMALAAAREKSLQVDGVTPRIVNGEADATQKCVIRVLTVEKGHFRATQVDEVQRSASHDE